MLVKSIAKLRYVSIPPRKMRLVADTVKGMPVEKALGILNFVPRVAAHHIAKTVKSAAANALSTQGTDNLRPEDLVIKTITVDDAPMQKRIRFQSMGRVYRYRKRFCHLTVYLEGDMQQVSKQASSKTKKASKKAESKSPAGADKAPKKTAATKSAAAKPKKAKSAKATAAGKTAKLSDSAKAAPKRKTAKKVAKGASDEKKAE